MYSGDDFLKIAYEFCEHYYQIDSYHRQVRTLTNTFFQEDGAKPILINQHIQNHSFDDILFQLEAFSGFEKIIKNIFDQMKHLFHHSIQDNADLFNEIQYIKTNYKNNYIVHATISLMEKTYRIQRKELNKVSNAAKSFFNSKKFFSKVIKVTDTITENINITDEYLNNPEFEFLKCNKNHTNIKYIINSDNQLYFYYEGSLKPFFDLFFSTIMSSNLHIYHCKHCGARFFETVNTEYCKKSECQKIKEKELRQEDRTKRKKDIYVNTLDTFHNYTRQLKHQLKLQNVSIKTLEEFDKTKKILTEEIKEQLSIYRTQNKAIDTELDTLIKHSKATLRTLSTNLAKGDTNNETS